MSKLLHTQSKAVLLYTWLAKEKKAIYKIYFLAIVQTLFYIVIPLGIQGIITYTMAGKFSASLILLSLITIISVFFIGVLQLWQMRLNETLQERIFGQLIDRISRFVPNSVELKSKIYYFFEIVTLQKGIGKILLDFSFSIISIVFGLLILPAYSPWFLIFSVMLIFSFLFILGYYGKKAVAANVKTSSEKYRMYKWLTEKGGNKSTTDSTDITNDILSGYIEERKGYYQISELQYKAILIFKVVFVTILLFVGSYLVQVGELNIGQFVASEIIVLLVINSVEKLVSSLGVFYDLITALYKIEDLFKEHPEVSFLNSNERFKLSSIGTIYRFDYYEKIKRVLYSILIVALVILFAPWTQSVEMKGKVTALSPQNKPQKVTSRISGRIEKWYINDGDFVQKNDTIAFISEIKDDYVDPQLIERSESQIKSKESAMESYESKINAIHSQIDALNKSLRIKTEQVKNKFLQVSAKLNSDSIDAVVAGNNLKVVQEQFNRYEDLLGKGVISKTDLENRKVKLQDAISKKTSADNKIINTKNELLNVELELNSTQQEYSEKLMKAESEKYSIMSLIYDAEGSLTKLQNSLSNYSMRKSFYYVLAPQDGYVNNIEIKGVGEIIKDGGVLCSIVPVQNEQAVELFVDPVDLPLMRNGQQVQLIFDGWPSFVFSGWPGVSYGAFQAEVVAYDKVISNNGKFRILAMNKGKRWPEGIQIGGGANGFALLKDVPLVYELWRKINGFPPDFYIDETIDKVKKDDKE
jgi:adhesin transport system membrane fusion protein